MAAHKESDAEAYSGFAIANNNMVIDFCRTSVSAMAGMSAGVLGLTGLSGFFFYFAASIFLSCLINVKAGQQWRNYFISWWSLSTNGILGGLFTYVLFWTHHVLDFLMSAKDFSTEWSMSTSSNVP